MPPFEIHCEESLILFGKSFEDVHKWLDEFAGSQEFGYSHRRKRHHTAGIQEAIKLFGADAGPVAKQHIITDLKDLEDWTENDHFPEDENDYTEMGLY